jgi:hypothetical protein
VVLEVLDDLRGGDPSPEGATTSFFRGGGRSPPTPSTGPGGSVIFHISVRVNIT